MEAQKYLISEFNVEDPVDQCKYQLRVVTRNDHGGDTSVPVHIDWLGFGTAAHPKGKPKIGINWMLTNNINGDVVVAERGALSGQKVGIVRAECISLTECTTKTRDKSQCQTQKYLLFL